METKFRLADYKTPILFLIRLLAIYFALYLSVNLLIGATAKGGTLYFPWLDDHFDIIQGFRGFLLNISEYVLSILGYDPVRTEFTLNVKDGPGIRLVYACMGFELICGYSALILAYPYYKKRTIYYLLFGIAIIELLNIIRISGLTILFYYGYTSFFEVIDHHDLFNLTVIVFLIMIYIIYLKGVRS